MYDTDEIGHHRLAQLAQLAQARKEGELAAWRKERDRERRRMAIADAFWYALHAARWMMLGAALVLTSVVQSAAVNLAVALTRPCVDDSSINCSVTAPNGTRFASIHVGDHLIIMVHNDRP